MSERCIKKIFCLIFLLNFLLVSLIVSNAQSAPPKSDDKPKTALACNVYRFDVGSFAAFDPKTMTIAWEFGDGATSSEASGEHTYTQAGEYTVNMKVSESSTSSTGTENAAQPPAEHKESVYSEVVQVKIPPKAVWDESPKVCAGEAINLDASPSATVNPPQTTYRWDFGDGTQTDGLKVTHRYSKDGNFTIKFLADNNAGQECNIDMVEKNVSINTPPIADAGEDINWPCLPDKDALKITFDASHSYDNNSQDELSYSWDFGDGTKGEGETITHPYEKGGRYEVTLTVKDNSGLACNSSQNKVTIILGLAPRAQAGPDATACVGEEVDFDGTTSSVEKVEGLFANWEFGDKDHLPGLKNVHKYGTIGIYNATLTVQNTFAECPASIDNRVIEIKKQQEVSLVMPKAGLTGKRIYFEAKYSLPGEADQLDYYWHFADGTIVKGKSKANHVYHTSGIYDVKVVVADTNVSGCLTPTSASQKIAVTKIQTFLDRPY